MSQAIAYSDGADVDFDKLNDENISKLSTTEKVKTDVGGIDTNKIFPNEAYDQLSGLIEKTGTVKTKINETPVSETPKEKFERIKIELSELKEDLDALSGQQNTKDNLAFTAVFKELNSLQSAINEIYQDPTLRNVLDDESLQNLSEDERILALKAKQSRIPIQTLFDEIKNAKVKGHSSEVNLILDSKEDKIKAILIFEDLQRRIKYIKNFVGENKNILADLQKHRNISKFLDDKERSILVDRVKKVTKELELIAQKQKNYQDLASGINVNRLMELNNGYTKIQKQNDEVPIVFERLESLKNVHEESANLTIKLQTLRETQNAVISKLKNNNELLVTIDTNLTENLKTIKENITNLDERLKKLGQ